MDYRKHFLLSEEVMQIIEDVKCEEELKSYGATIEFMVRYYVKKESEEELIQRILATYDEQCRGINDQLKMGIRKTEQNTTVLLDVMNTYLINNCPDNTELVPTDDEEHALVLNSKKNLSDKIARMKQMKDTRDGKRKKGSKWIY